MVSDRADDFGEFVMAAPAITPLYDDTAEFEEVLAALNAVELIDNDGVIESSTTRLPVSWRRFGDRSGT